MNDINNSVEECLHPAPAPTPSRCRGEQGASAFVMENYLH